MREIKFRTWDESQKYMAYQGTPDLETLQSFILHYGDKKLMQFTGLKDKNGAEIYEGDILNVPETEFRKGGIHRVYYFNDGFVSSWYVFKDDKTANKESLSWILKKEAYKIGNIHENPELLK